MTEDTHIKLVKLGDEFSQGLAELTAKILKQIPPAERHEALMYLQDRTSLFSARTAGLIEDGMDTPIYRQFVGRVKRKL